MRSPISIPVFLCFFTAAVSAQTTIRVPQDHSTIQAAVNAANTGDTVLVSEGTYVENIRINKRIVVASLYITDWDTSHISKTIIDGSNPSHPYSGSTVTIYGAADTTTLLKGFTITGGTGNRYFWQPGNNYYVTGGGIRVDSAGVRVSKNRIVNNRVVRVDTTVTWTEGGGMSAFGWNHFVDVIVDSNFICSNSTDILAEGWSGGLGAAAVQGRIVGNMICHNRSTTVGGGLVFISTQIGFLIAQNIITDNTSYYGGGVATEYWAGSYPTTLRDNIIARNKGTLGGGVYSLVAPINLVNNTVAHNTAAFGPGLYMRSGELRMLNNIFWNPIPQAPSRAEFDTARTPNQLFWWYASSNLIRGGMFGAINADPLFADTISYTLSNYSPAIGSGRDSITLAWVLLQSAALDCSGKARPRPSGSNPDIGAVEHDSAQAVSSVQRLAGVPVEFRLEQNYPNPFNPSTVIRFQVPGLSRVKLIIYDVLGREVTTLVDEEQPAGVYEATWDAQVSSGVYFYRLEAVRVDEKRFVETKKLLLLK